MHLQGAIGGKALLGTVALVLLVSGCGQKIEPQPISPGEARIRKFGMLYHEYSAVVHKKPANLEELKAWAKKLSKTRLTEMEIQDIEEVFVSPRDQQPFVMVRGGPSGARFSRRCSRSPLRAS